MMMTAWTTLIRMGSRTFDLTLFYSIEISSTLQYEWIQRLLLLQRKSKDIAIGWTGPQ